MGKLAWGRGDELAATRICIWLSEKKQKTISDQVEKKIHHPIQFWICSSSALDFVLKTFLRHVLMANKYSDFLNVNKVLT